MAITGAHVVLHTPDPEGLRATLRDVFGFAHVDAGGDWLIFALPPAELAVHPSERSWHQLTFMCDDVHATVAELKAKSMEFSGDPEEYPHMVATTMRLPGGVDVLLYEPRHPTAIGPNRKG